MRALVVLPLVLCVLVCVDQGRAEVKPVKLCGREFLRAVVYTCGGSRWRRYFTDPDMNGEDALQKTSHCFAILYMPTCGSENVKKNEESHIFNLSFSTFVHNKDENFSLKVTNSLIFIDI